MVFFLGSFSQINPKQLTAVNCDLDEPFLFWTVMFLLNICTMLNFWIFIFLSRPFLVSLCEILSFWQLVTFYNFLQLPANPQRVRAYLYKLPPYFKNEAAIKSKSLQYRLNHCQERKGREWVLDLSKCVSLTTNCIVFNSTQTKHFVVVALHFIWMKLD